MKILILVGGLALRFFWIAMRGSSRDELTSLGYVLDPSWQTIFWDNAPPTFYVLMKALWSFSGSEWVLRLAAFLVSGTSFVLFFRFLDREERNLWLLGFWAVSPTSVVNATFRPTIFAELAGILFFLALRSGRTWKIAASVIALAGSTFVAVLAPIVALSETDLRDRKKILVIAAGVVVAAIGATRIEWRALGWLGSESVFDLLESSVLVLSQLWGFSLPLFLAITWVLVKNRQVPRSFLMIVAIAIFVPLLSGHRFASSRFLILLTPWVLFSVSRVLQLRRDFAAGALIVLIPAVTTFWFLMHEKSGWREAGEYLSAKDDGVVVFAPPSLVNYLSPKFNHVEGDLNAALSRGLPRGGWIVRANPARDIGMKSFIDNRGNTEFFPVEVHFFGKETLEPVLAVKVARRL